MLCSPLAAQERTPWKLRLGTSAATMVSADQLDWLGYDQIGLLADVHAAYRLSAWLDVQAGAVVGLFVSNLPTGGLTAPTLGALARLPVAWSVKPYGLVDLGVGLTGSLVLPFARVGVGLDIPLSSSVSFGPVLGLGVVMQTNGAGDSSDARYLSLGVAFVYSPYSARAPASRVAGRPERVLPLPPPKAATPPREVDVPAPSVQLLELVDGAVPARTDQIELLAPVLFVFDSDELEASGVAMLHEVARELRLREHAGSVEIRAYADARGSAEYNRALGQRRAGRVRDWLIEHGIEAQRLKAVSIGANELVEAGSDEAAHQQNRRVVFRIQRAEAP